MAITRGKRPVVSLLSKEMVVPAKPTHRHSYFLSCFDILWTGNHYNQRVIFYEGVGDLSRQQHGGRRAVFHTLKSSLALCLVHYYPWCGRLSASASASAPRLSIDCNDAGVEFVDASVDLPCSLLSQQAFQMKPFFEELCRKVDHTGDSLYSSPLLSIQATLFSDGGLALGISQSHVVADGQALWNFMVSWGECARGLPLSMPPVLDRKRLAVPNPSLEKATWEFHPEVKEEDIEKEEEDEQNEDGLTQKNGESVGAHSNSEDNKEPTEKASAGTGSSTEGNDVGTQAPLADRVPCVFNLPSSAVKKLKVQDGGSHTAYEVTCAHLWKRVTSARQRPFSEPTFFFVLANCRSRVKPPLPPAYFGNVIAFGISVTTSGKIRSESLHATATRIHDAVVETIQGSLENVMHWLETHDHDIRGTIIRNLPKGKGINVASSPRFPAYDVDFGWGKPVAVRSPKVPGEGEMVFFGGNPKSTPGDVEICTGLPRDVLKRLLEDPLFLGKPPNNPFQDQ